MKKILSPIVSMATILFMVLSPFTALTPTTEAQATWWSSCSWNCTAGEFSVTKIWLGDSSGNLISGNCNPNDPVNAYIWGEFDNNAQRYTVTLLGDISKDDVPAGTIDECVGTIPSGTSSQIIDSSFNWSCGEEVKLTNLKIIWAPNDHVTCSDAEAKILGTFPPSKCSGQSDIIVVAPLVANFTSNSPQCLGTPIQFTANVTGGITPYTYSWNFGDSSNSSSENPSHQYTTAGTYDVTLTATDSDTPASTDDQMHQVTVLSATDPQCAECQTDEDCSDGLYCNGQETCVAGQCADGTAVDCSGNSRNEISTCSWVPDGNSYTFDFRNAFNSTCQEDVCNYRCTTGDETITHTCDVNNCQ